PIRTVTHNITAVQYCQRSQTFCLSITVYKHRSDFLRLREKCSQLFSAVQPETPIRRVSQVGAESVLALRDEPADQSEFRVENEIACVFAPGHPRQQHTRKVERMRVCFERKARPFSCS